MSNKLAPLVPDAFYHVFNRANGNEKLFLQDENCRYFLQEYQEYISPIADTFCYCLMENHFHFLIRIKSEEELQKLYGNVNALERSLHVQKQKVTREDYPQLLSSQFSKFFNSYSKSYNKRYARRGSLFMHRFNRKQVKDQKYLKKIVLYIHNNPVVADLCETPGGWTFSSYQYLLSSHPDFLMKNEVIDWFNDDVNFTQMHLPSALSA